MQGIFSDILGFVISFGLVVAVHELGHLVAAKILGIGVQRFSIGIGKRLFGIRRGETDYCLSLVPIGGYVRLAGDATENPLAAEPSHINSTPAWKSIIVYLSGPLANIVLALLINFAVNLGGYDELHIEPVIGEVIAELPEGEQSPASRAGIEAGDLVVAVDGEPVADWSELSRRITLQTGDELTIAIERGGEHREFTLIPWVDPETGFSQVGIRVHLEPVVSAINPSGENLGFKEGDRILSLGGTPVASADDYATRLDELKKMETPPAEVTVAFQRGGKDFALDVPLDLLDDQTFALGGEVRHVDPGLFGSLGQSTDETFSAALEFYTVLYLLMAQRIPASEAIGGPISIASVSGKMAEAGFSVFLRFVALLSVMLGIMNTLPIPMLDGGMVTLLVVEAVRGRAMSLKTRQMIQYVGIVLLGSLLLFALYSDLKRVFFN
ncbi:MAG: RIP metalloprotease RseP [bacterium]|nr:RIP metalloprotease RseP [bacterium]